MGWSSDFNFSALCLANPQLNKSYALEDRLHSYVCALAPGGEWASFLRGTRPRRPGWGLAWSRTGAELGLTGPGG